MEIRTKPLELCKTRIKKSSLDMLNFYVVWTGRDLVDDTDKSTTCRRKSRAPPRKIQKMKVLSKTWVSPNNPLYISHQKLKTFTFWHQRTKQRNHRTSKATTEDWLFNQEEINWIFLERSLQVKTGKTSARLQLVKSWNDQQVQWHYQCRHVQAQTPVPCRSPTLSTKYALKAS